MSPLSECRCGETKAAPGENVYNALKPILLEKEKAENALKVRGRDEGGGGCQGEAVGVALPSQQTRPTAVLRPMRIGLPSSLLLSDKMAYVIICPALPLSAAVPIPPLPY